MKIYNPVVLVILDGWGEWDIKMGNAVAGANLPTIKELDTFYPKVLLQASGPSVGLPWGIYGNSEVGHQTIGSGQIIFQFLPTIDAAIGSGSFFKEKALLNAINWSKKNNSAIHLVGLTSDGGVHSHVNHLFALMEMIKEHGVANVFIHAITDGRDTAPTSAKGFIALVQKQAEKIGVGKIASVSGRYYTMDRNQHWDRMEKSFSVLINGQGITDMDPKSAIEKQYAKGNTDEYLDPICIVDENNKPIGTIKDNDSIICFNFRKDRSRQLARALSVPGFNEFPNVKIPKNLKFTAFTEYEEGLPVETVFPPQKITTRVGEILAQKNKTQLRIAEMEKFAHVTYFFNGGQGEPFPGEDRMFVPSNNVMSYAETPEMSAGKVTEKLVSAITKKSYDFILVNYANADMVGHTGNFNAGLKAVEYIDSCLRKVIKAVFNKDGCLVITADHGNIEEMLNLQTGEKDTEHSTNPVPCWLVRKGCHRQTADLSSSSEIEGIIADIAPTVLELMDIAPPDGMLGHSLVNTMDQK